MNSPSPPNNHSTEVLPAHSLDNISSDDELLVAYLDGELEPADKANLESRLATEPALRNRLAELRSAWDLLDELPVTKPDPNFAQSTIEMVAMSAAQLDVDPSSKRRSQRWTLVAWLAMPLLMLLGYGSVRGWYRYQEHLATEEVHLLADWDALKAVGSYEWLEKLTQVQDLSRVSKRSSTSELGVGLVPRSNADRRAWIANLNPTDRDRLSANLEDLNRFKQGRSKVELNKIIELGNRIYASSDAESLLQVARSYAIILSDMSVTDRASHLDITNLDQRQEELQQRVNRKLVEVHAHELPPDSPDKLTVAKWKKNMETATGDSFEETLQDSLQAHSQYGDALDKLLESLSPATRDILGRLKDRDVQHLALIWYFVYPKPVRPQLERKQAIDQFNRQPAEIQAQLEFMPPEEAQIQLGVAR